MGSSRARTRVRSQDEYLIDNKVLRSYKLTSSTLWKQKSFDAEVVEIKENRVAGSNRTISLMR